MGRNRSVLVGSLGFVLAVAAFACSDDPNRPPATSSGGTATSSSGGGSNSSSGGGLTDGGATVDGSSSGNDAGTTFIQTGYRATVDSVATEFDVTPTALRQSGGYVIELIGTNAAGDVLRITMTNGSGVLVPGAYDCTGGSGNAYSVISYTTTNGTQTWSAVASGACTVGVQSIDNQSAGIVLGTFSATVQKSGSPDKVLTKGEFRMELE